MTELSWFQFHDHEAEQRGDADAARGVHGFETAGLRAAQEAVQARVANPKVPHHPLEEVVGQIRTGRLRPCPAPDSAPSLELSEERIEQLAAQERQETREEKVARLRAELEALGAEPEDVSSPSPSAGADGDETPHRRARAPKAANG